VRRGWNFRGKGIGYAPKGSREAFSIWGTRDLFRLSSVFLVSGAQGPRRKERKGSVEDPALGCLGGHSITGGGGDFGI